ncbi:MAG: hypothetical protein MK052_00010 [Alphaproteobacteria bacterium]|nr:hypothetical protein [Alphaproteobacteria bacterium]
MTQSALRDQLAERFAQLDAKELSPPIEIAVGDCAFYPYRSFCDILEREDFKKITQNQLRTLIKIADDILAMQHPALFEAFVNDDGIIVVDKAQPHIEYSIDIEYNDARSRVEEVYPQVTYPQGMKPLRMKDKFVRNDTAHEVAHHADFWLNMNAADVHLSYMHSSSTLLAWLEELDHSFHPQGIADLFIQVREAEGYVAGALLEEGYPPAKVDEMLRAEFFAIAGEYYYGSKQCFSGKSALLEAYMQHILQCDLDIQIMYIPFEEMERRRGILRNAIHAPVDALLASHAKRYYELREMLEKSRTKNSRANKINAIEALVVAAVKDQAQLLRKKLGVDKNT